jgi:SAM-dependent methyltransferase
MGQKTIFLDTEADAWYSRNRNALDGRDFATDDSVVQVVGNILKTSASKNLDRRLKLLEVGCGDGGRLAWLSEHFQIDVSGVEPSKRGVQHAHEMGVDAKVGTADSLPFADGSFDILIFGFCLYLCDRQDLFRIAQEADRVLKADSWLVIHDFYTNFPIQRDYHHRAGVLSFKMDYRTLFDWHPFYTCYSHTLSAHCADVHTDDPQEWVATSVLRKRVNGVQQ